MLDSLGVEDVETIIGEQIPDHLRLKRLLDVPGPIADEYSLRRHLDEMLDRNDSCQDNLNFLGGGCWQHHVPAVCDEIARRSEYLTGYFGEAYSDFGKYQALFEYQSLMAELVEMDVVCLPVYSWGGAAGYAARMAARITGRKRVLVPDNMSPERLAVIRTFAGRPGMARNVEIELIPTDADSGRIVVSKLEEMLGEDTAAVYFENPGYLGFIEENGEEIARMARRAGAETIVGVDPTSLGILTPPAAYGADITVGELQPLGVHMQAGGGLAGFIATPHEESYVNEHPSYLLGITDTVEGEAAFFYSLWERTSYMIKETDMAPQDGDQTGQITGTQTKDFTGTISILWGIVAGVYLSLMGPEGMRELGTTIAERSQFAASRLSRIDGVEQRLGTANFKEFVLDFEGTGKTVAEINGGLREHGIFGGKDLSTEFPQLGNSSLYCVTEVHTLADIERLASALETVVAS